MASDADVRAVLKEHGIAVTKRGKLGARHYADYERITGHAAAAAADGQGDGADLWDGPDDNGDITTAALPPTMSADRVDRGDDGQDDAGTAPQERPQERRPRRVRAPKPGPSWLDKLLGKTTSSPKKKTKHPRLSTDRLISRGWSTAARIMGPVSGPTSRTLSMQAPVAGLILEDSVRDTIVDTFLQPAVRAEEHAKRAFALAGPPLLVAAIEKAQGLEEPMRSIRLGILVPMLEEALRAWVEIAGDKVAEAAEQIAADAATQAEIQRLIAVIFPQAEVIPDDTETAAAADMAGAPA